MRLHEREQMTRAASLDLNEVMLEWMRRHRELTYLERAIIMAEQTNVANEIKYALRIERHGTDEFPGGAEHTDELNDLALADLQDLGAKLLPQIERDDLILLLRGYGHPEPEPDEEDGVKD